MAPGILLFHLLAGITIALGVIVAGPLTIFGFLVLPAVAARPLVTSMAPYFIVSSLAGAGLGIVGFAVSYRFDLPLGPTGVVLGCGLVLAAHLAAWAGSKAGRLGALCVLAIVAGGIGCTAKPGPVALPVASVAGSPLWLAPVRNSTGTPLRLPATNPLEHAGQMLGKRPRPAQDTVPALLRATVELELRRQGIAVSHPKSLDPRLRRFPGNVPNALRTAREAGMTGRLLILDIRRWLPEKRFVNVRVAARLIDVDRGAVSWETIVRGAVPTPGSVTPRDAHVDGVRGVVARLFGAH